jgi:hypothetical protein
MEPNKDKNLERILKKAMNASNVETPSTQFTLDVMSQITALEAKKVNYTPIISNKTWIILIALAITLVMSLYVLDFENETTYMDTLNTFISVDFSFFQSIPNMKISNIVMYGILLFGIMFGIQIPILKYYYAHKLKL